ncbi:hypothetical protein AAG570_009100 [Ranatra chinensis]|uniref:cysteine--tRNA ligase n=1 Tax=Ranatra chinensis TaxID=642074 RepID=A0ABD0YUX4_9HEMI
MTGLRNGELGGWRLPGGHETDLRIYNLCEKKKVKLITNRKNLVSWYTCGPTVYDSAHIGHACCYVKLDILRRILQDFLNLKVVMVMGVTDIDDKIIARANECNENFNVVSRQYEKEFFDDISSLGVLSPSKVGRVTDYIPEIICFVRKIVESGYGYSTSDVSSYPFYGKLVPTPEKNTLGCVLGTNEKRSPLDFALWKGAKLGEPSWNSPWGPGRPGWHIECSTIASILLGPNIDLHSGGVDLIFPHHENEEAQSCAYHDTKQWVNYWIHTGHLYLKGDVKMSKSLKNTISIKDFLSEYTSDDLRMFCLISPYRNGQKITVKDSFNVMIYYTII